MTAPRDLIATIMSDPLRPRPRLEGPPVGTDAFNAALLIEHQGTNLRYSHAFKKWLIWLGEKRQPRWVLDLTGQHEVIAKNVLLRALSEAIRTGDEKLEKAMLAALYLPRLKAMVAMAQAELAISTNELDQDPYALNCTNGTIDLRTSALREHDRNEFITKLISCPYDPRAQCRLWLATLHRLMGGGPDAGEAALRKADRLVSHLQRIFGYALTGITSEKAVFVFYGSGNNGKSTILSTFRRIIPDYSAVIQADTLMTKQENNNAQADLADLHGARFAQTSETEEGQRLSQGKLKRITQGMGLIKAVRKYENPFEFPETHKLFMDTNRRPEITDGDDRATFARLNPIPFTVTIPDDEIDRDLPEKLFAEAQGILAWAVEGARLWFESGLQRPQEIGDARAEWQAESDQLGRFVDDCCVVLDSLRSPAEGLYAEYSRWVERSGERRPLTATTFGRKLGDRGFDKQRTNRGAVYLGIGIRTDRAEEGGEK